MSLTSRGLAIRTISEGQAALDALLAGLSDEELNRQGTIGDGDWSAKDLIGHIAFWEDLANQAITSWLADRRPAVERFADLGQDGIDAANAREQERIADEPLETVRARARTVHAELLQALSGLSDETWLSPPVYANPSNDNLHELLGSVLSAPEYPFGHVYEHLPDLQTYVESLRQQV